MDPSGIELDWLLVLGAILVLLVLSGFFSGSETALTAASRPRLHLLSRQGNRRAGIVLSLLRRSERLIGAILLGNNLVNILASALATSFFLRLFGDAGVAYATLVMTMLVLVFAEVLPKTYALNRADRLALVVAPLFRVIVWLLAPMTMFVDAVVRWTLRLFGIELSRRLGREEHEEELRGAIELHKGEPDIDQERQMLRSILDLDDVEVSEVMTHRREVTVIDADLAAKEAVDLVLSSPFTRIPLYRGEPDNIIGVVHAKALLRELSVQGTRLDELDITAVAAKPWFIPETTSLLDQLQAFRERREHFAVVVDEYGALQGIVTLEDILEEIVGDIDDEHDISVRGVRPQPDGSYIVEGSVTLRELHRNLGWDLPDADATTIAGLVLHEARRIPEPGQIFSFYDYRFEIMRRLRNQITVLRVTPPGSPTAAGAEATKQAAKA